MEKHGVVALQSEGILTGEHLDMLSQYGLQIRSACWVNNHILRVLVAWRPDIDDVTLPTQFKWVD